MANTVEHILDENGHFALDLAYDPKTLGLTVTLRDADKRANRFRRNILEAIQVTLGGENTPRIPAQVTNNSVSFSNIDGDFALKLGRKNRRSEKIGDYSITKTGVLEQKHVGKLVVSETRRIGSLHEALPYSTEGREELFEQAEKVVTTDYHTHSSAQISAKGLMDIAFKNGAYYPLHLMVEAGIDTTQFPREARTLIDRVKFPPLEPQLLLKDQVYCVPLNILSEQDRQKLTKKMVMPTDAVGTYTDMEYNAYRFRYPLIKENGRPENKKTIRDSIKEVVREYQRNGVKDAEITYVGLDNPNLLKTLHEVMGEIEAEDKEIKAKDPSYEPCHVRFLMGIPRAWSTEKIAEQLKKAKVLSQSPYISGIDFVGYEVNKSEEFKENLEEFAGWVNDNAPGFVIRAHAGENDKNRDNVREILELAQRHKNLRIRIGHALYGMDDKALNIARELLADPNNPRVVIEINSDSNIALNNIDDVRSIPLQKAIDNGIPFVVGSDGAGIYQTTPKQLGMNLVFAGITKQGLDLLTKHQNDLIAAQRKHAQEKAEAIEGWNTDRSAFMESMTQELAKIPSVPMASGSLPSAAIIAEALERDGVERLPDGARPARLHGKVPITIIGASGGSWDRISPEQQREVAIAMDMLTHMLDPHVTYFVQGRHKPRGLTGCLQHSIKTVNDTYQQEDKPRFYTMGILAEPKFNPEDKFEHLTHVEIIDGKLLDVSNALVNHTQKHNGVVIAAGGAAFTRDATLEADKRDVSLLLMDGPEGASSEKAKVLNPKYRTVGAIQLISKLFEHRKELFLPELQQKLDMSTINALYEASAERVETYAQREPDPQDQEITDGATIAEEKGRRK